MSILQRLYDSGINASVETFWDDGFRVRLGEPLIGWLAENKVMTWKEAERWLDEQARIHFPDSDYARSGRPGFW